MKLKHYLAILLFSSFAWYSACGQNLQETLEMAQFNYNNGNYNTAVEAYKRVLFFDKEGNYAEQCYFETAECLFNLKAFNESEKYYDLAFTIANNDSLKNEIVVKKASALLLQQKYQYALFELMNLSENSTPAQNKRQNFYLGITYFNTGQYEQSKAYLLASLDSGETKKRDELEAIFEQNKKTDKISPKKARIMSTFLPGLGQLYVGDIKNGINSMVIVGGLFYLGLNSAINNGIFDAAITVYPWFQRYYMGGYNKAETIAIAKIQEKRAQTYNNIISVLEQ
jgi:tetratricopeptide (TPR) repeat protein